MRKTLQELEEQDTLKVFISQPMGNRTSEEIHRKRKELINEIKKEYPNAEIEILDSFFEGEYTKNWSSLRFLAESLKVLDEADIAVFSDEWGECRGCLIERECAIYYDITILTISSPTCTA